MGCDPTTCELVRSGRAALDAADRGTDDMRGLINEQRERLGERQERIDALVSKLALAIADRDRALIAAGEFFDNVTSLHGELALADLESGERDVAHARELAALGNQRGELSALQRRCSAVESRLLAMAVTRDDAVDRLRALAPDAVPVWYEMT